ncbi:MAG: GntR family transcriptional regulator [Bacillota bacterium]
MDIIIANTSDDPIYRQIVKQFKNMIIRGDVAEGELLPSIRTLARELQISVITTKRAYEELERESYIVTVPGKGTFIAAQDKELFREMRLKIVEEKLSEAVDAAKSIELGYDDMRSMLKILYEEV